MPKPTPLTEQLREAIRSSGMTRYAICKAIGLTESTMSKFMGGTSGLSFVTLDKLGAFLGLRLVGGKPTRTRKDR